MEKAIKFKLTGRVQGVGMRVFIQDLAMRLDLLGYVRNHENGFVEGVLMGEESDTFLLLKELERVKGSFIYNIETEEVIFQATSAVFEIRD